MNPYAILGVSTCASDQEIKNAYRRLAKLYHPDRQSPDASHEQIAAINHAYDILSNPAKRAQYDRGFSEIFIQEQEDPIEAYKREFKRKRWEREKREREEKLARKSSIYLVLRLVQVLIFIFMIGFMLHQIFTEGSVSLFYAAMAFNAGYVFIHQNYSERPYKFAFINIFLFLMILLAKL